MQFSDIQTASVPRGYDASEEALLDRYLADIRHTRVLDRTQEQQLGREMAKAEADLRAVLAASPSCWLWLVERWETIRRARQLTSTLTRPRTEDGGDGRSGEIDASFFEASELLQDRRQGYAGRLRELFRSIHPRLELLFEFVDTFEGKPSASVRRAQAICEAYREARDRFVRHNLRLTISVAKRFRGMGVSFLDLIQEGNLGLMRAVEKFDPNAGFRFSTYGVWWIRQSCVRAVQNTGRTVRLPTSVHDKLVRLRRVRRLQGEGATRETLADELEVSEADVARLIQVDRRPVSLDEPIEVDDTVTAIDRISDENSEAIEDQLDLHIAQSRILPLLKTLTRRERQILSWRFGLDGKPEMTLQQIGGKLGLSRERVRQIEQSSLCKLRRIAGQSTLH